MHCVKYHNFTLFPGVNSLSDLLETMRKLCLSTKFPLQEIRWNYSILRSDGEIQLLTCTFKILDNHLLRSFIFSKVVNLRHTYPLIIAVIRRYVMLFESSI